MPVGTTYTIKFSNTDDVALFPISDVNPMTNTWVITGDFTTAFPTGANVTVSSNTGGGNGVYEVATSYVVGPETFIVVTGTIPPSSNATGYIADPKRKASFNILPGDLNDSSTSLTLPGQGRINYGEYYDMNLVHIMENFAKTTPPINPTIGQCWFNTADEKIRVYVGLQSPASDPFFPGWAPIQGESGGATGSGPDKVFWVNDNTITTDYTVPLNKNAMSAGPITVASGVTVLVPSGSVWTIV